MSLSVRPYNPDPTRDWFLQSYDEEIPLAFDNIYYVENPENSTMNQLVRQYFQQDPNSKLPHDLRQIRYRLHYFTRSEIQADKINELLKGNDIDTDSRASKETIALLCKALHADTGGFLVARVLSKPQIDEDDKDDEPLPPKSRLMCAPLSTPADMEPCIKEFICALAKTNFESLAGVSYDRYYSDKYEIRTRSSSPGTMGFLIARLDIHKVDKTIQQTLNELLDSGKLQLSANEDINNTASLLKKIAKAIEDNQKIDKLCKLEVDKKGDIFIVTPQKERIKCRFKAGLLGKALYILFLRQIERADHDNTGMTPKSICLNHLERYTDELTTIYKQMDPPHSNYAINRIIKEFCDDNANERSRINKFFENIFYTDIIKQKYHGKHYSFKIVGKDPKSGLSLYALGLDVKDFDLGNFSIHKLQTS